MTDADAYRRRVSAIGPYFAVSLDPAGVGWLPLAALWEDPAVLCGRIAFVRGELARRARTDVDDRVAASVHHLGLVARLVAPALGMVAVAGVAPHCRSQDVRWQANEGGPVPIAFDRFDVTDVPDPVAAAAALADGVIGPLVTPVVDAFAGAARVSRIVLWGNVASALAGATSMLGRSDEPLLLDPVDVVTELLARAGPLAGAGRFGVDGRYFVRASCCLFYRIPNAGTCGDCVLL